MSVGKASSNEVWMNKGRFNLSSDFTKAFHKEPIKHSNGLFYWELIFCFSAGYLVCCFFYQLMQHIYEIWPEIMSPEMKRIEADKINGEFEDLRNAKEEELTGKLESLTTDEIDSVVSCIGIVVPSTTGAANTKRERVAAISKNIVKRMEKCLQMPDQHEFFRSAFLDDNVTIECASCHVYVDLLEASTERKKRQTELSSKLSDEGDLINKWNVSLYVVRRVDKLQLFKFICTVITFVLSALELRKLPFHH